MLLLLRKSVPGLLLKALLPQQMLTPNLNQKTAIATAIANSKLLPAAVKATEAFYRMLHLLLYSQRIQSKI